MMQPDKLIFIHNTRCSGNALNLYFYELFREHIIKMGKLKDKTYSYDDIIRLGQAPSIRFILGHNVFGLHQKFEASCEYFTNLRDPVDRLLSGYRAWTQPGWRLQKWLNSTPELDNGMTRRLAGIGNYHEKTYDFLNEAYLDDDFQVSEKELDRAIEHIDQYCPINILQEDIREESLMIMEETYQLPPLFSLTAQHLNHPKTKLEVNEIDPKTLAYIKEKNRFDYQLLAYCRKRMIHKIQAQPESFQFMARARRILSNILHEPGKDTLKNENLNKKIEYGINRLIHFGMHSELTAVLCLIIQKESISYAFGEHLCKVLQNILSSDQINQVKSILEKKQIQSSILAS